MNLPLRQLRIGKVDGKHEYLTPASERDRAPFDSFLIPENVDPDRFNNSDIHFVEGFRGTGKTSLLRWHAETRRTKGIVTDFILFKSDLTESERMHISKEVGISWTDVDPKTMEISQDFKAAWTWFILHKIGENLKTNSQLAPPESKENIARVITLLGLADDTTFKKAIGFMPKLDGASVKIRANLPFFEAELGGDFKGTNGSGTTTLNALSKRVLSLLSKSTLTTGLYIYFDELEAFYHSPEQYRRDQRMVRDLLFAVSAVNDAFRIGGTSIHIVAAVRSEVVDAMGSMGEEVDRVVHDKGFHISWHHARRSLNHPLIEMIRRKIRSSDPEYAMRNDDPIASYFPLSVDGFEIDAFILDRSFYKPRDVVWRLSLAQKLFPNELRFTQDVLHETETEYSAKLWDEVRYELSATYSPEQVDAIESVLSGGATAFDLRAIEDRFDAATKYSSVMTALLSVRSVREILTDLYRLGAIGNSFRTGASGTDTKNRWAFRGDPNLLADKRMIIHPALIKRLSAVATRRRGSKGAGR